MELVTLIALITAIGSGLATILEKVALHLNGSKWKAVKTRCCCGLISVDMKNKTLARVPISSLDELQENNDRNDLGGGSRNGDVELSTLRTFSRERNSLPKLKSEPFSRSRSSSSNFSKEGGIGRYKQSGSLERANKLSGIMSSEEDDNRYYKYSRHELDEHPPHLHVTQSNTKYHHNNLYKHTTSPTTPTSISTGSDTSSSKSLDKNYSPGDIDLKTIEDILDAQSAKGNSVGERSIGFGGKNNRLHFNRDSRRKSKDDSTLHNKKNVMLPFEEGDIPVYIDRRILMEYREKRRQDQLISNAIANATKGTYRTPAQHRGSLKHRSGNSLT